MSVSRSNQAQSPRIALEDIITAASEGALRALEARRRTLEKGDGFYVDLHIRIGIPAPVLNQILSSDVGTPAAGGARGAASE